MPPHWAHITGVLTRHRKNAATQTDAPVQVRASGWSGAYRKLNRVLRETWLVAAGVAIGLFSTCCKLPEEGLAFVIFWGGLALSIRTNSVVLNWLCLVAVVLLVVWVQQEEFLLGLYQNR